MASFESQVGEEHIRSEVHFEETAASKTRGFVRIVLGGFSSGNKSRDGHARRSLDTVSFPTVELDLRGLSPSPGDGPGRFEGFTEARLALFGQDVPWEVPVALAWADGLLEVTSEFTVSLDDFGIPRDKLFFVPIDDEVPVRVALTYRLDAALR